MNQEELVALVTRRVLEAIRETEEAPAAAESGTPAVSGVPSDTPGMTIVEGEPAKTGATPDEVVIGLAPAFGASQVHTICGLPHADVLREITAGIEEEGLRARYVRFRDISDVSFIAQRAAKLSGSGIGIGIQNFPEGAAISLPLRQEGFSRRKAFAMGTLSGLVEPVFGMLTVLASFWLGHAMPWLLSFAAGAMIYVVVEELIPEAHLSEHTHIGTMGFMIGFLIMMILDVALG